LEGTGNMIVDKILGNYKGTLIKPGLLWYANLQTLPTHYLLMFTIQ
jgi:hypothetical protein